MSMSTYARARKAGKQQLPHVALTMFRCERLACTLTQRACAERWCKAQTFQVHPERLDACRHCTQGELHATNG